MFVLGLLDFLNSREDAALVWLIAISASVLYKSPAIAGSMLDVVRQFFAPKLLFGIWIPATAYVGVILYFAEAQGLWHTSSLKETLYWYASTGLVLAGSATQASDPTRFWALFGRVLKVTIVVEFVVNLYVFPLAIELVLIPTLVLFGGMQVIAERDPNYEPARRFIGFVLTIAGVAMVAFAIRSALLDLDGFLTREHLEQFLVPLMLTVTLVPFLYYVALWSTYELVFTRVNLFVQDRRLARRAKRAIASTCV